jgi:RND family efflux transporter MFP subunit
VSTATKLIPETKSQKQPHQTPVRRRRWRWLFLVAVIVAVAAAAGWHYYVAGAAAETRSAELTNGAESGQDSNDAIPVETVRLSEGGIIRTSTQIGTVQPFKEADLYAKVSGYLKTLDVDYGSKVKLGELLAEIDDPEIITEARKAAADVEQANAAVGQAEAFIESAKADRDAAASAVEKAKAEVNRYVAMTTYHGKKFERYKQLVRSQALPQQLADEEEENYESSRANELAANMGVLSAEAQLMAAKARVKKAEADLVEARANVDVATAKKATADVLVGYTKITSPYDGVITKRNFFPGAFIHSAAEGGAVPMLTVARTDKVRVVTAIPDRDVPLTNVGDPAEVTLDAMGTEVFKGTVSRFADAEDPGSRTMHTEIDLPNPNDRIKPGMYGIAKVILDTATKNSTLPAYCLVGESKDGKGEIFVIKDRKAKKTKVTVGADDGIRVEILSGITPDTEVIVNTGSVTDGVRVRSNPRATEPPNTQTRKSAETATKTAHPRE